MPSVLTTLISLFSALLSAGTLFWVVYSGRKNLGIAGQTMGIVQAQSAMQQRVNGLDEALKVIELKNDVIDMQEARLTSMQAELTTCHSRIDRLEMALKAAGIAVPQ